MKVLRISEGISFMLFILFACGIEKNILLGVVAVMFLLVFFILTRLEETFNEREKSHKEYFNRKYDRDNDITYATYDSNGNEHFTE